MATSFYPSTHGPPTAPAAVSVGHHGAPAGTFAPGTKVQVGGHRVIVEKYLSEGGFAHVYLVRLPKAIEGDDTAVLKRVAVPDKDSLASMRTEVDTMKKLKGHRHIVTYIDSHASQLKGGGYEVFLLMEYCNGGGLIDFMNTRLQNRLTEPEILNIFADVALGVACMHYLKPPLLHRDLKVENVLIRSKGSSKRYKLCDFGSTAPPRPAATSAAEGRLIEDDVQKNTTLQYRSPEMVDVYRRQPIDEKSDIWALGVLLYKLCYYKTPFEEQGQMAILNASFKFPSYPTFSDRLKKLIATLLREQPQQRPNIYQVVKEVASLRGSDVPIKDIYATRTQSQNRRNQELPTPEADVKSPAVIAGAFRGPSVKEELSVPEITPMRRGRPSRATDDSKGSKPSPSPARNVMDDPFKALDTTKAKTSDAAVDDISTRFPALDEFSLLHDSGAKFAFDQRQPTKGRTSQDLSRRVTNALADEAFAVPKASAPVTNIPSKTSTNSLPSSQMRDKPNVVRSAPAIDIEKMEKPKMVSTGTMTSPPPPSPTIPAKTLSSRPIFRIPPSSAHSRSTSLAREQPTAEPSASTSVGDAFKTQRPGFLDHRSKSQIPLSEAATSSETGLDGSHRASHLTSVDSSIHRSRSANAKSRPASMQTPAKPSIFRRLSRERSHESPLRDSDMLQDTKTGNSDGGEEAVKIDSNVEYLKAMEGEDGSKKKEKRLSSGSRHIKRSSMPSVSLSGTKNLLAGRFGEAFRRFEGGHEEVEPLEPVHSPVGGNNLTPIAGSEATDSRSDDGNFLEESEEMPPDVRRELERRRLSQEEKRVADAAAAHRQRIAEGADKSRLGPNKKAISIQSKVKSLLDESGRASPSPTKTASGYGRYTDQPPSPGPTPAMNEGLHPPRTSSRQIPLQLTPSAVNPRTHASKMSPSFTADTFQSRPVLAARPAVDNFRPPNQFNTVSANRPVGPPKPRPKPEALRTGDRPQSMPKPASLGTRKPLPSRNPYQASSGEGLSKSSSDPRTVVVEPPDDEWEANFSKRYPDLSGLEWVETEIDHNMPVTKSRTGDLPGLRREMKVRDV